MIKIHKIDKELTEQCSSCHCENSEKDMYLISVGYTERQTTGLRLCEDCLLELGDMIYQIYKENTDMI